MMFGAGFVARFHRPTRDGGTERWGKSSYGQWCFAGSRDQTNSYGSGAQSPVSYGSGWPR